MPKIGFSSGKKDKDPEEKKDSIADAKSDDLDLPLDEFTTHVYRSVLMASVELNKFLQMIFKGKSWPVEGKHPKYFVCGLPRIEYPDIGRYDPEYDHFGPGLTCYAVTTGFHNAIGPLRDKVKDPITNTNPCVLLLELLNHKDVFKNKVKQLCSDWEPHGWKHAASVSSDGARYVFHPKIPEPELAISRVMAILNRVNIAELMPVTELMKNDVKSIREMMQRKKLLDKEMEKLNGKIEATLSEQSFGAFWSPRRPGLFADDLQTYEAFLMEQPGVYDVKAMDELQADVNAYRLMREELDDIEADAVSLADNVLTMYDKLLETGETLSQMEGMKQLAYSRSCISSLRLSLSAMFNNIDFKEEAKFKVLHVFIFNKNLEAKVSFQSVNEFEVQTAARDVKKIFYDDFEMQRVEVTTEI